MNFRNAGLTGIALSLAIGLALGCHNESSMSNNPQAVCHLTSLDTGSVRGKVYFTQETDDVLVEADFDGLTPGKHGIHIHEHGDCGGTAGEAAGGHFNPSQGMHGMAGMPGGHEGDLGNLVAGADGHAHLILKDKELSMSGDKSIIGRSIIVHAQEDDLMTQPAGNSGARIACGLIVATIR
jgi:Cu-Zn family superoxide dismutase